MAPPISLASAEELRKFLDGRRFSGAFVAPSRRFADRNGRAASTHRWLTRYASLSVGSINVTPEEGQPGDAGLCYYILHNETISGIRNFQHECPKVLHVMNFPILATARISKTREDGEIGN